MPSLEQLERLLAADPNDAFVLYGIAQEYAKLGQHARSLEFFDRCLAIDPAYCYAYYHKARVQFAAGDHPGAVATLRAGIAKAREIGDAHAASEMESLLDEGA